MAYKAPCGTRQWNDGGSLAYPCKARQRAYTAGYDAVYDPFRSNKAFSKLYPTAIKPFLDDDLTRDRVG